MNDFELKKIIVRVFPRTTSMTPADPLAFVGDPPLWRPLADEVHVSVTFTWDREEGERLAEAWEAFYPGKVRIGGPAYASPCSRFVPGTYIKPGVTFTTRGCNKSCPWCLVPTHEGRLREIKDFAPGHVIQDNNLLQASRSHLRKVFAMLHQQKRAAVFAGGLDATLLDDWVAEELRGMRIREVFLAADTEGALRPLERAVSKIEFLQRRQLRCYVLLAYGGETIEQARARLERVWEIGCMPFAQLYQPLERWIDYPPEWKALARKWSRPAIMLANGR